MLFTHQLILVWLAFVPFNECCTPSIVIPGCAQLDTANVAYALCPCLTCTPPLVWKKWWCCNPIVSSIYCKGCSSDTNNNMCTSCNTGYDMNSAKTDCGPALNCDPSMLYLDTNDQTGTACIPCTTIRNCLQCSDYLTCTKCFNQSYGVIISGNTYTCDFCSTLMQGCILCSDSSTCLSCDPNQYVLNNNICQNCGTAIPYCLACSSLTNCLSCWPNTSLLNVNGTCLLCSSLYLNCLECDNSTGCKKCLITYFSYNISGLCVLCQNSMKDCLYCQVYNRCQSCIFGQITSNGCSKVIGCIRVNPTLPISNNCLECDSKQFLLNSTNHTCYCIQGKLIGLHCLNVFGCTNAYIYKSQVNASCVSCNNTMKLVFNNGSCLCQQYYHLDNYTCQQICGDGYLIILPCDDGNNEDGDGCSHRCQIQTNYTCLLTSSIPASQCIFRGRIFIELDQIQKDPEANSAIIFFNFIPFVNSLTKMNITSHISFNPPHCQVLKMIIIDSQLQISITYNQTIQGLFSNISMSFDTHYIRSPKAFADVSLIQSYGMLMVYNPFTGLEIKAVIQAIYYMSIAAVFLLFFGTFAYKLIGVETFSTFVVLFLLQVNSQLYEVYFISFKHLNLTFGLFDSTNFSIGSMREFNLIGYNSDTLQRYDSLSVMLMSLIIFLLLLKTMNKALNKYQIMKKQRKRKQSPKALSKENSSTEIGYKMEEYFYDYLFCPIFLGFTATIVYKFLKKQLVQPSIVKNSYYSYLFYFILLAANIFVYIKEMCFFLFELKSKNSLKQLFSQMPKYQKEALQQKLNQSNFALSTSMYNFVFLGYFFLVITLLEIQIYFKEVFFQYCTLLLIIIFVGYIIYCRPYKDHIHHVSIVWNCLVIIYNIIFILVIRQNTISKENYTYLNYAFVAFLFIIELCALLRIIHAFVQKWLFYKHKRDIQKQKNDTLFKQNSKSRPINPKKHEIDMDEYGDYFLKSSNKHSKLLIKNYIDGSYIQTNRFESEQINLRLKKEMYIKYFKKSIEM